MGHKPVSIYDERTARIDTDGPRLEDRPRLYTPSGKAPIGVSRVELTYNISTGQLGSVTAFGDLVEQRDIERRRNVTRAGFQTLSRQVPVDWRTHEPKHEVPGWLLDMIERYRPPTPDGPQVAHVVSSYVDLDHVPGWQDMVADLFAIGRAP